MDAYESFKRGYEAGYMWGRVDQLKGVEYDTRTPGERFKEAGEDADDSESRPVSEA